MATYYADFDLTTGLNDGSSQANAFQSLQDIFTAIASSSVVGGDVVLCKDSTDTLTATPTYTVNIDPVNPIYIRGVNSSYVDDGDGPTIEGGGSYKMIDFIPSAGSCRGLVFENFTFQNSSTYMFNSVSGSVTMLVFDDCQFLNAGSHVFEDIDNFTVKGCYFSGTGGSDFQLCRFMSILSSFFISGDTFINQSSGCFVYNCIVHDYRFGFDTTGTGSALINNILDDFTIQCAYARNNNTRITGNRLTNSPIGINCSSSADGSFLYNNYFYLPSGTDLTGADVGNLRDLGDNRFTVDNSGDGYTDRPAHDFSLTVGEDGVGVELNIGVEDQTEANSSYVTQGLPPRYPAGSAPDTFAGVASFEILSNNKFYVSWPTATGDLTSYNIYLGDVANPFSSQYLVCKLSPSVTSTIVHIEADNATLLKGGTVYYCGVRVENSGTEETNTTVLSNICSGSELIQRQTNTIVQPKF